MKQTAINISELHLDDPRLELAVKVASDKKAQDIVVLDLNGVATFTSYFIICHGRANRQVQAIADEIGDQLTKIGVKTSHIEGYQAAEWVLMDYGDFIVHIFNEESRSFYELERLWSDAQRVDIQDE